MPGVPRLASPCRALDAVKSARWPSSSCALDAAEARDHRV
jgi:hypothetical protein